MCVQVVGLDMDYTLIHYDVNAWEGKAFAEGVANLQEMGCPVEGLTFQPDLVIRGLIVDKHLGNIVKADRFGYLTPPVTPPARRLIASTWCTLGPRCGHTEYALETCRLGRAKEVSPQKSLVDA